MLCGLLRCRRHARLRRGHGAEYGHGTWQTLAGYQSASNIEPHSKIDLDMEELETKVGEYATNANWVAEAMFIYENGGNGVCVNDNDLSLIHI